MTTQIQPLDNLLRHTPVFVDTNIFDLYYRGKSDSFEHVSGLTIWKPMDVV